MTLEESIDRVWKKVRSKYFYPALKKPIASSKTPEGRDIKTGALVYEEGRKIFINPEFYDSVKNYMNEDDVVESILDHEVAHHSYCPRDFGTTLEVYSEIRKVVDDTQKAENVMQYFFDCIVNTHNVVEKETKIPEFYKMSLEPKRNDLDMHTLVGMMYQETWGRDLGLPTIKEMEDEIESLKSKKNMITNDSVEKTIEEKQKFLNAVKEISEIDYLDKSNWSMNSKRFSKIVEEYADIEPMTGSDLKDQFSDDERNAGVKDFAQNSTPKEFEEILRELDELEQGASGMDAGLGEGDLKRTREDFYKLRSSKYSIPVESIKLEASGSMFPESHSSWEVGDPAGDIDFWSSYGRVLPGITQKWNRSEGQTHGQTEKTPDCLIVIDSSGSMTDPEKDISKAVLGAGAAADAYLKRGSSVAVYNFSDANSGSEMTVDFTTNRDDVYEGLCSYYGGGTVLNYESLDRFLEGRDDVDIFMITDMEIANRKSVMDYLSDFDGRLTAVYVRRGAGAAEFESVMSKQDNTVVYEVDGEADIAKIIVGKIKRDFGLESL